MISKLFRPFTRPIVLLILINVIVAGFVFQDFGVTWDEPLFYRYASAVSSAYSIQDRIAGQFDLQKSYGPTDHRFYGPAYLLLADPFVALGKVILPARESDIWHLVNFLTFLIGSILLYYLLKRWISSWAAFAAVLLFTSQPTLWGFAWIDPKDMPFMVFFLAAVLAGFSMVDRFQAKPAALAADQAVEAEKAHRKIRLLLVGSLVVLGITLILRVLAGPLEQLLAQSIHQAHNAAPGTLVARVYALIARNAATIPEAAYVQKGLTLFRWLRIGLTGISIVLLVVDALIVLWPYPFGKCIQWIAWVFSPLPTTPSWRVRGQSLHALLLLALVGGTALGMVTSIRVLGPLAGALVVFYFLLQPGQRSWLGVILYGTVALLVTYLSWPYLWDSPVSRFFADFQHMANNPVILPVLYNGQVYMSDKLPASFLPGQIALTLTEPVLVLAVGGLALAVVQIFRRRLDWRSMLQVFLWFLVPMLYVVLLHPPVYDSFRHFMFVIPPVFVFVGLSFQYLERLIRSRVVLNLALAVLALPGLIGLVSLHPYQYAYYNSLVGGTNGAFRRFETEFWLTCYRQAMTEFQARSAQPANVYVVRQPMAAKEYASPNVTVASYDDYGTDAVRYPSVDKYLLLTTRTNLDQVIQPDAPELVRVEKGKAVFCVMRKLN
ncbi:MAG TPA: hypothetical protein VMT46_05870 [Anaerolineaceae bacterium]|nr:hypothetical protein [Anaerolineaceae bacterium]